MKIKVIIISAAVLGLSACSSIPDPQMILTKVLPPDFVGDIDGGHINPYFDFNITAKNVRKNKEGIWTWDAFDYQRADFFHTKGHFILTPLKP